MKLRLSMALLATLTLILGFGGCDADLVTVCGQGPSTGGAKVPPVMSIEMGRNAGTFDLHYQTRNAHDQIEVFYEGKSLFNSGCVGETRDLNLQYGPGEATHVDIVVTPNCKGTPMTSWLFEVGCPVDAVPSVQVQPANMDPRR